MDLVYILVALLAGACAAVQAGINAQLRLWTKDPFLAALISFAVGTLALILYAGVLRPPLPDLKKAVDLPLWTWSGGILGAFLVVVTIILAPKLGAATTMVLLVGGTVLAGLFLDHFGLVGYHIHAISGPRLLGGILVILGVVLIKHF